MDLRERLPLAVLWYKKRVFRVYRTRNVRRLPLPWTMKEGCVDYRGKFATPKASQASKASFPGMRCYISYCRDWVFPQLPLSRMETATNGDSIR